MIDGVKTKQLKIFTDDRGFLTEILKDGEDVFKEIKQATYTESYSGVIKAFHWHKKQWDIWFVAGGMAQVVLHDLRKESPTYKQTDVFYFGDDNHQVLLIPPGVAHGYRVLGKKRVRLMYFVTEKYNPEIPDEERIPFDDKEINFDWNTKNK
jgi:dTDP-4-dehydrorhamnose 3,5-epimerase